jgi:hypothetical protein
MVKNKFGVVECGIVDMTNPYPDAPPVVAHRYVNTVAYDLNARPVVDLKFVPTIATVTTAKTVVVKVGVLTNIIVVGVRSVCSDFI